MKLGWSDERRSVDGLVIMLYTKYVVQDVKRREGGSWHSLMCLL